jgi:hypothetical protein
MAVLSPCCAEFQYVSIHQKKRTAKADNKCESAQVIILTRVRAFGRQVVWALSGAHNSKTPIKLEVGNGLKNLI